MITQLQAQQTNRTLLAQSQAQQQYRQKTNYLGLFRFATKLDYFFMFIGVICSCSVGVATAFFAFIFGNLTNTFQNYDKIAEQASNIVLDFIYLGIGIFLVGWTMVALWIITGQRQGIECRKQYLKSLLYQDLEWLQILNPSQLVPKFEIDILIFQQFISGHLSSIIKIISFIIASLVISLSKGWLMSLVCLSGTPLIVIGGLIYQKFKNTKIEALQIDYIIAGKMVKNTLQGMRTVKQFNSQQYQSKQYRQILKEVTYKTAINGRFGGLGLGCILFATLITYSLGFWFASYCVQGDQICLTTKQNQYTAGDTVTIFFSILFIGVNINQLIILYNEIQLSRKIAFKLFQIIDKQCKIKTIQNSIRPSSFIGHFLFQNVSFSYQINRQRKVIKNLNLQINKQNSAFLGEFGSGRSTIVGLMMRFYDPSQGRILLDGIDLKQYDIGWLRSQIGYLSCEPALLNTSIRQNMLMGLHEASDEQLKDALQKANILDLVQSLKDGLQTNIMSLTQKQLSKQNKFKFSIARLFLQNPKIILLFEVNQFIVNHRIQYILNKLVAQKIKITFTSNLSNLRGDQYIFMIKNGILVTQGAFSQFRRPKIYQRHSQQLIVEDKLMAIPPPVQANITNESNSIFEIIFNKIKQLKQKIMGQTEKQIITQEDLNIKQAQQSIKKYDGAFFGILRRLFQYIYDKKIIFGFGVLAAIVNGAIFPIFGIFLAKMLVLFINFNKNIQQSRRNANLYALLFLIFGIAVFIFTFLEQTIFSFISSKISEQCRNETYLKMLKMPLQWFDDPKNELSKLQRILSQDCQKIDDLVTTYSSIKIQSFTTIAAGIIIAIIFEWRTGLISLAFIILAFIVDLIKSKSLSNFGNQNQSVYKESSNIFYQSIKNIKLIASFNYQRVILEKYSQKLRNPMHVAIKKGLITGFFFGLSQVLIFVIIGVVFDISASLIASFSLNIQDVFISIYTFLFAGVTVRNNIRFIPDISTANISAVNIFNILDSQDQDQLQIKEKSLILTIPIYGNIVFQNVQFKYPTQEYYTLKNINFKLKQGQKMAICGQSQYGKRAIFDLLLRFYEPTQGYITIDGRNIRDYNIHHLRSTIGIINHSPLLFNQSISKNIVYNKQDTNYQNIIQVAKYSSLQDRIFQNKENSQYHHNTFPAKQSIIDSKISGWLQKNIENKGQNLTTVQIQQISLARTLLRQPQIMLIDEQSSPLNKADRLQLMKQLYKLFHGKIIISITDLVPALQMMSKIIVLQQERIVQQGNFIQLSKNQNISHYLRQVQYLK